MSRLLRGLIVVQIALVLLPSAALADGSAGESQGKQDGQLSDSRCH